MGMIVADWQKSAGKSGTRLAVFAYSKSKTAWDKRWDNPGLAEFAEARSDRLVAASLPEVMQVHDDWKRNRRLEDLGISLAETNVKEAFAVLDKLQRQDDRDSLIRGMFHFVGQGDRKAALKKVVFLNTLKDRNAAFMTLALTWNLDKVDPFLTLDTYRPYLNGRLLMATQPPQTEVALEWAGQLSWHEGKDKVLGDVAGVLVKTSPTEALQLGENLQGENYVSFLQTVAAKWAQTDPQAALAWSMQIPDMTLRESLQQTLMLNWAVNDATAAKEELRTLAPGPTRALMLEQLATTLGRINTTADEWANSLPNPAEKATAQQIIAEQHPAGVGLSLKLVEGLPVVDHLVNEAPAGHSKLLGKGDRILGVDATGNGTFVSTNGMSIEEVSAMVRGTVGTTVRLRVAALNAKGFDAPHVVQLARERF